MNVEELVEEITPRGRGQSPSRSQRMYTFINIDSSTAAVPAAVKTELLQRVRKFLGTVNAQS